MSRPSQSLSLFDCLLIYVQNGDLDGIKKFINNGYIENYFLKCGPTDERLKFGRTPLHLALYLCNLLQNDLVIVSLTTKLLDKKFPYTLDDFEKFPGDYYKGEPWKEGPPNDPMSENEDSEYFIIIENIKDKIVDVKKQLLDETIKCKRYQQEIDMDSLDIICNLEENLKDTITVMEKTFHYLNNASWEGCPLTGPMRELEDKIYFTIIDNLRDKIVCVKKQLLDEENNFERHQEKITGFGCEIIQDLNKNLEDTIPIMEKTLEYIKTYI